MAALEFKVYSLHFATQSRSPAGRKRPAALRLPSQKQVMTGFASPHLFLRVNGLLWLIIDHEYKMSIIGVNVVCLSLVLHSFYES